MEQVLSHNVEDWLQLHALNKEWVAKLLGQAPQLKVLQAFLTRLQENENRASLAPYDLQDALTQFIYPALQELFGEKTVSQAQLERVSIVQAAPKSLMAPFTRDMSEDSPPEITLVWSGVARDILDLMHEMAHAAQYLLSRGQFMPPMAREVCAFLGELALIDYVRFRNEELYRDLCSLWHEDNIAYLGKDLQELQKALAELQTVYHYRLNYPLARLLSMAQDSLLSQEQTFRLFKNEYPIADKSNLETAYSAFESLHVPGSPLPFSPIARLYEAASVEGFVTRVPQSSPFGMAIRLGKPYGGFGAQGTPIIKAEDTVRLMSSLSPYALECVFDGEIDPIWLFQKGSLALVDGASIEEAESVIPAQNWSSWRSLGVLALTALKQKQASITSEEFLTKYQQVAAEKPCIVFSDLCPWMQPLGFDLLASLGLTIHHLAKSPYHQQFLISDYLPIEILPPLRAGQLRQYVDAGAKPQGFVSWARLSEEARNDIHRSGRALATQEWTSGTHPFVNDWVSEPTAFPAIMKEMRDTIFPQDIVSSIRRNPDGTVRRVNKWKGRKYEK